MKMEKEKQDKVICDKCSREMKFSGVVNDDVNSIYGDYYECYCGFNKIIKK